MISQREKEILRLIAQEYTTIEIARQLHISGDTVKIHRRSLLLNTGYRNTAGLVRRGFELNLFEYSSESL